jgi:hypothetical protein
MLAPENLSVKKIAGEEMTGEKLYWHMQFYLKIFQSNKFPTAKYIYESTVTRFLQDLVSNSAALYKEMMANGTSAVQTHDDFDILHLDSKYKAVDFYNNEKKIGGNDSIIFYRKLLIKEIEKLQAEQNQTIYLKIENILKDRALEDLRNATLHELQNAEELKKKQELAELKANEAMAANQENIRRMEAKDLKISALEYTLQAQKRAIDKHEEEIRKMNNKLYKVMEDLIKCQSEQIHTIKLHSF